MGMVEQVIAAVSPRWAAERAYFRSVLDMADSMKSRKYEAAKAGRLTDGWYAPATGANAEIGVGANRIRNRGRELCRNNPWSAGVPGKVASGIVGTGIFPRLVHPDLKSRRAAKDIWNRAAENADIEGISDCYAMQHIGGRCFVESGEFLIRYFVAPIKSKTDFPLKAVVLEPDFLDSSKDEALADGGRIVQGVQYNADGSRAGYWLFDEHPGETYRSFTRRALDSHFVAASEVDHVFDMLRPGQARGVSMFAPVAIRLHNLGENEDAETWRRKVAACFVGFVRLPPGSAASPLGMKEKDATGKAHEYERMRPGMIKYLRPGEEMQFADPPTAEGLADVLGHDLRAVAAGLNITYEMLTGDLRGVNFISGRLGRMDYKLLVQHWQWHMFKPMWLKRYWERVGRIAAVMGLRRPNDPWTANWIMPPFPMLQPEDEIKAASDAVRANMKSPLTAVSEMSGEDPDDIFADTETYNARLDEGGMISDMDPRNVGRVSAATVSFGNSDKKRPKDGE
jgi:lambda family phage portal protein